MFDVLRFHILPKIITLLILTVVTYLVKDRKYIKSYFHSKGISYSFLIILISRLFFLYCFINFIYFIVSGIFAEHLDTTILGEYVLFIVYVFYFRFIDRKLVIAIRKVFNYLVDKLT